SGSTWRRARSAASSSRISTPATGTRRRSQSGSRMARHSTAAPAGRSPASANKSAFPWIFAVACALSVALSLRAGQVDPRLLVESAALANVAKFVRGMFPPQLSREFLGLMLRPTLETVQISVIGTAIAILIGVPLGLVATSSLTWQGVLHERE